ncbi:MAG: hypothetical protein SNJ77_07275, partial [Cytophagales bacterium]
PSKKPKTSLNRTILGGFLRSFEFFHRLTLCVSVKRQPTRKWHIWFFADTRANAQKTKRAIFCQRSDKRTDNKK